MRFPPLVFADPPLVCRHLSATLTTTRSFGTRSAADRADVPAPINFNAGWVALPVWKAALAGPLRWRASDCCICNTRRRRWSSPLRGARPEMGGNRVRRLRASQRARALITRARHSEWLNVEFQERFWSEVVHCAAAQRWPVPETHKRHVLRRYIGAVEDAGLVRGCAGCFHPGRARADPVVLAFPRRRRRRCAKASCALS